MFGQHKRNLDDKSRVVLPPVFKEELGSTFYITLGFDGNAELRSQDNFRNYISMLEDKSFFDKRVRDITRIILGNAFEVALDNQNRISLPKHIVSKLSIQKEVVFVGVGSFVELWSSEKFEAFENQYSSEDLINLAQMLSER
ncbi:division/cell wall cluster transcriptional repressor MraZ [Mycoplasma sp. NEAQ87857]|uniref:division/cell wall cluster transcriptional repressor MraZ n=1 Tax=Mycoplasma sp. NEAQ87857 TaxID=2683967 RepID=UPI001316A4D3|nr:division/cell wall cluster transcriptional repressor MraZ [Mycoplasma sp. NEAQ87857]QGZ97564.1 division/cell wall cluster transcriptional repressor MraZ [Mycoplasma sp. NEAQ87857]